jgi:hypothetical protein
VASYPKKGFFWFLFSVLLLTAAFYSVFEQDLLEKVWSCIRSDLLTANAKLRTENEGLKNAMAVLEKQNRQLKKALQDWVSQFSILDRDILTTRESGTDSFQDPVQDLDKESFLNQQIFRALLAERKRWDSYQQSQYQGVLEGTLEPAVVSSQYLTFEDDNIREAYLEMENALNLHKKLIRDIRLFHDEVQYRQKQLLEDPSYQLYDLKFNLEPFARESAMADALQQAMSALGAGIYPQESAQVLDRLGDAFINPIQELSEWLEDPADTSGPNKYNYNFYIVFGKKLMNYADALSRQSLIPLAPSALGELDFFSRKMASSLLRLYEAGEQGDIDSTLLDMETLEGELP